MLPMFAVALHIASGQQHGWCWDLVAQHPHCPPWYGRGRERGRPPSGHFGRRG